ncbi:hypothetical protein C8R41DRAFT_866845 [Lentinula lateritia]|uniref:Uncharacterized protein n=1 Tax=Lentinula lateritia TaxID=40482 RepID=A0ABQ8VHH3_9AGAR|nr:hypothetical protein C8R41DRAFT_866845 [Lentinula lateritia]
MAKTAEATFEVDKEGDLSQTNWRRKHMLELGKRERRRRGGDVNRRPRKIEQIVLVGPSAGETRVLLATGLRETELREEGAFYAGRSGRRCRGGRDTKERKKENVRWVGGSAIFGPLPGHVTRRLFCDFSRKFDIDNRTEVVHLTGMKLIERYTDNDVDK